MIQRNLLYLYLVELVVLLLQGNVRVGHGVSVEKDLTLSQKEKAALDKFKAIMIPHLPVDYMKTDIYLIRWLRARNLNVQEAEKMLKENLRWRKEWSMDTILSEDWSDMQDEFPMDLDTRDKAGRPVAFIYAGKWDIRNAILSGRYNRMLRYGFRELEEMTQQVIRMQQLGKRVTQWKAVFDLDGFNPVMHGCPRCLLGFATFVDAHEQHYPGFADAIIFINTPQIFQIVQQVARPFISSATRETGLTFGTDKAEWKEYLTREIGVEQLRPEFGGTRED